MYAAFFGLRCRPFEDRPDPQFSFLWPPFEEALAALEYEARYGPGMGLVIGEAGTGKTQLLRTLVSRLPAAEHAVLWTCPPGGEAALLPEAGKALGLSVSSEPPSRVLERMRKQVARTASAEHRLTLIIDQAENLTLENLKDLESVAGLRESAGGGPALLLAGQPRFRLLLAEPQFARLQQWLCGERVLVKLGVGDTAAYVRQRLKVAGAATPDVFEQDAIAMIHGASGGVPRLINRLCDEAMVAAYGAGVTTVTRELTLDAAQRHAYRERSIEREDVVVGSGSAAASRSLPVERRGGSRAHEGSDGAGSDGASSVEAAHTVGGHPTGTGEADQDSGPLMPRSVVVGDRMPSGATLLARLESALARAERFASTSEASLAHYAAVEKHLGTMSSRAEKLIIELQATLRSGHESGGRLKEGIGSAVEGAEQRVGSVARRASQVEELTGEIEKRLRRADEVFERAERLESHLASVAEQLADKAADVQERVNLLLSAVDTGAQLQASLHSESSAWDERRAELERLRRAQEDTAREAVDAAKAELDRVAEQAVSEVSRAARDAGGTSRALQTAVRAGRALEEELTTKITPAWRARVEDELAGFRKNVEDVLLEAQRRWREQVMEQEGRVERGLRERAAKADELVASGAEKTKRIDESLKACDARVVRLEAVLYGANRTIEVIEGRAAKVQNTVAQSQAEVEKLSARASASHSTLKGAMERAEELVRETQEARGQWEALQSGFTASLVDLGLACERAQRTEETVRECERSAQEVVREKSALESLVLRVQGAAQEGGRQERALRAAAGETSRAAEKIGVRLAESGAILEKLGEATASGQELLDDIRSTAAAAEEATEHAERRCAELESVSCQGSELLAQLGEVVAVGRQLHEATQELINHADDKLTQLSAERPSAERLLHELRAANGKAQDVVAATRDAMKQTEEAIGRLNAGSDDARARSERAEAQTAELRAQSERASAVVSGLRESQEAAGALVERLSELIGHAARSHEALGSGCERAEGLIRRTEGVEETLRQVEASEGAIREQVAEAVAIQSGLRSVVEEASQHTASLETLLGAAREFIEIQERLGQDAETASARMAEQLEQAHEVVASAGEALGNFLGRAQSLEAKVIELTERTDALHGYVEQATAKPAALVEAARAQSAELERVCGAVRKVFTNLSRTTLDAHRQGKQLDEQARTTAQRLSVLTEHTQRASQTLEQWVREAVQAQSRLERTLSRCPSIRETHPGDEIRELASATASATSVGGSAAGGGLRMLREGSGRGRRSVSDAAPRGDEVARLIEEARHVEAGNRR